MRQKVPVLPDMPKVWFKYRFPRKSPAKGGDSPSQRPARYPSPQFYQPPNHPTPRNKIFKFNCFGFGSSQKFKLSAWPDALGFENQELGKQF